MFFLFGGLLILACALWLYLLAPNGAKNKKDFTPFKGRAYAHRGLHDAHVPENSCEAFEKACALSYGIELDVQLTKDGKIVVFHDATLERMCHVAKKVSQCTHLELQSFTLNNSHHTIPTLMDVLTLVNGNVPLIIELKGSTTDVTLAKKVADMLSGYHGAYCVESFNPFLMHYFRKHHPHIVRGQLSGNLKQNGSPLFTFCLRNLFINCISRPDFIAYEAFADKKLCVRLIRTLFSPQWVIWTVKSIEDYRCLSQHYDMQIFEGFLP